MQNFVHFISPKGRLAKLSSTLADKFSGSLERQVKIHDSLDSFRRAYKADSLSYRADTVILLDNGNIRELPAIDAEYLVLREEQSSSFLPPENCVVYNIPQDDDSLLESIDVVSKRSLTNNLNRERQKRKNVIAFEGATGDVARQSAIKILEDNEGSPSETKVILLEYGSTFDAAFNSIAFNSGPKIEEQYRKGNLQRGTLKDIVDNAVATFALQANSALSFSDDRWFHLENNAPLFMQRNEVLKDLPNGYVPIHFIGSNYPEGIAKLLYDLEADKFFPGQFFTVEGHDYRRAQKALEEVIESTTDRRRTTERIDRLLSKVNLMIGGTHETVKVMPLMSKVNISDFLDLYQAFRIREQDLSLVSEIVAKHAGYSKKPNFTPFDYVEAIALTAKAIKEGANAWLSGPVSWNETSETTRVNYSPKNGKVMGMGISLHNFSELAAPRSLYSCRKSDTAKFYVSPEEAKMQIDVFEKEKDKMNSLFG